MRDKDKKQEVRPADKEKGVRNAENPQTQSPTPGNMPSSSPTEKKGGRTPHTKEYVTGTDTDGQTA